MTRISQPAEKSAAPHGRVIRYDAPDAALGDVYRSIRRQLAATDAVLKRVAVESRPPVRDMARHLLRNPGKRLRAALVLFSARSGRADPVSAAKLAAIVEMLHLASLVHDDILDGAERRRNQRSLHVMWGTRMSVLMGDYLLARLAGLLMKHFKPAVTVPLMRTAETMCDGEIEEAACEFRPDISVAKYLDIVRRKTATLMAGACEAGAALAGANANVRRALRRYGEALGMAFQLVDDALDFCGNAGETGKPVGSDLAEGRTTYPVLCLRDRLKGTERASFMRLLSRASLSNGGAGKVLKLVNARGCVFSTIELAGTWVRRARRALAGVPANVRGPLGRLADYALKRRR